MPKTYIRFIFCLLLVVHFSPCDAQTAFDSQMRADSTQSNIAFRPNLNRFRFGLKATNTAAIRMRKLPIIDSDGAVVEENVVGSIRLLNIDPVFQFRSKRRFVHEFGLDQIANVTSYSYTNQSTNRVYKNRGSTFAFSYSLYYLLYRTQNSNLEFLLGMAFGQTIRFSSEIPYAIPYPETIRRFNYASSARIVPRIAYVGTGRIFGDLSFPIHLVSASFFRSKVEQPYLNNSTEIFTGARFQETPFEISAQISIGIKL